MFVVFERSAVACFYSDPDKRSAAARPLVRSLKPDPRERSKREETSLLRENNSPFS
jgi:hypothetical protein